MLPCPRDPVDFFSGEHFEIKCTEFTLALHKSRLMAISRSFQSRQVMQQFLLDRLIG